MGVMMMNFEDFQRTETEAKNDMKEAYEGLEKDNEEVEKDEKELVDMATELEEKLIEDIDIDKEDREDPNNAINIDTTEEENKGLEPIENPKQFFELFINRAKKFSEKMSLAKHKYKKKPITKHSGQVIGDYIERMFQKELVKPPLYIKPGNPRKGYDLPGINTDIKSSVSEYPQNSIKVEKINNVVKGLGYNIILFHCKIDDKDNDKEDRIEFRNSIFIDKTRTADYRITKDIDKEDSSEKFKEILKDIKKEFNEEEISEEEDFLKLAKIKKQYVDFDREVYLKLLNLFKSEEEIKSGYLTLTGSKHWHVTYGEVIKAEVDGIVHIFKS